jgi:DEAD/DEAH box helicase domain-containing protein
LSISASELEPARKVEIKVVFFDLETQRSFQEVGGRHNIRHLGLSVAVTYSTADSEYHYYTEENVAELIEELKAADLVVGFNLLRFDYEVLRGYTDYPLWRLPTVDIMDEVYRALGFRVGLNDLASATLGIQKSADGLQAIRWWRQGRVEELFEYCRQDVEVTKRLYEFGRERKYVQYWDRRGRLRRVPVRW